MQRIPILLYHSISNTASRYASAFAVGTKAFHEQLDSIVSSGRTSLTVSSFADALRGRIELPRRPIVITFDDGFSNFVEVALEPLLERDLASTLYVTTGFLAGRSDLAVARPFDDPMLSWTQLPEIASQGVEIGSHTHSHPHLDILEEDKAWREIADSKRLLEDELEHPVMTFAYPHGYSSPRARELVSRAGYTSACSVKNKFSSAADDPLSLARLTLRANTSGDEFRNWLSGRGARVTSRRESMATRAWRSYRTLRRYWRSA